MNLYNKIWRVILDKTKNYHKNNDTAQKIFQLRIPLCAFIEYKGVCCLAFDESDCDNMVQITEKAELQEWKEIISKIGFNPQHFIFKKIKNTDHVICYLNSVKNIEKNF